MNPYASIDDHVFGEILNSPFPPPLGIAKAIKRSPPPVSCASDAL